MPTLLLFVTSCLLAGLGGAVGSILGHALGQTGLSIGGILGGLIGAVASVAIARRRAWIAPSQFTSTSIGAAVGFLAAVAVAVRTLSSPVGPIVSTALVGIGAVVGAMLGRRAGIDDHAPLA